ncbi:DNA-protecting protein DprA [Sulfitobacter sp. M57]|uniref:DNA-processing protein DprA n=1 Tax=unclassified Sulfitobacter TaxID=196795 RepID=UPI0023E11E7B|nr:MULTISPECIES: DNA-processing protein DprA [unclassified Sulfitobacter]MDF3412984.1 DNA-protecting protein DprA [Sulfitobacter sp. KE5]MDF3421732.1 DNA-protecting protein DprA [Sulfitobacter sp. KE43]MDF3431533.1 DNA-protecting protein DprA [Sulfitobacter sp. KE42]MDF3457174.1 DNA-protecting protein DprA [Sulfitobacter sp. S74]MDF3461077.1 DNA-protecting protein DprA [Sulfitobacter sp. Ks18]
MTDKEHDPSSTHPPLPPTPEDEQFARLRLLRSRRVGIATYKRLLTEHGSAQNALAALPEVARAAGVTDYSICPEGVIHAELRNGHALGAQLVAFEDRSYPAALAEISDAPPFLWALGDVALLARPMVALVGARNASSLGTRMARSLARDLGAAGYVVVSGLARGIDAAAHHAALPSGTIAVQAGGVDTVYPTENTELARSIEKSGLRLSEHPIGMQPMARHFPSRNRIISGLSRAVVIVEAAAKSGSLITARDALDQGRDVLAVPGHPFDARAAGCNMLLRDGATLIRSAADVLEVLGAACAPELPLSPPVDAPAARTAKRPLRETAALHTRILARLGPSPLAEDQLIRDLHAPAAEVAPVLVDLELDGKITRQAGGLLSTAG